MKIYIFEEIEKCSPSYHHSGGVVVIAENRRQVTKLLQEYKHEYYEEFRTSITNEEWKKVKKYEIIATEPKVFIFPDSGCC